MRILKDLSEYDGDAAAAVAIGKFDGIHRGHRKLIEASVREAGKLDGGKCVVFVVDSPLTLVLTHSERRRVLEDMGVDVLIEQRVDPQFISTPADDFIENVLRATLHAEKVLVGEDFRFGFRRSGDAALLVRRGHELGYEAVIIPPVMMNGEKISTRRIREEIGHGHMEMAEEMLGYRYFIAGRVISGNQLGRTMGFPTANLAVEEDKFLPPLGVYYSISEIRGRHDIHGMTNVGKNPTVSGNKIRVETHFFDMSKELYGEAIKVELLHRARPENKFDSLDELRAQLTHDRDMGMQYFQLDSR